MEKKINLIPSEMAVPPKTIKVGKLIYKIATIGSIILVMIVTLSISAFIYFKFELGKINSNNDDLKSQILVLEQSDQKLILTKNRLAKIEVIKSMPSIKDDLIKFNDVTTLLSTIPETELIDVSIQPSKTQFSVNSKNSSSFAEFLEPISKLTKYKNVILSSFNFNQNSGIISDLLMQR